MACPWYVQYSMREATLALFKFPGMALGLWFVARVFRFLRRAPGMNGYGIHPRALFCLGVAFFYVIVQTAMTGNKIATKREWND